MRDEEGDPKQPRPVHIPKKEMGSPESAEAMPWRSLKDLDRDRHRHL